MANKRFSDVSPNKGDKDSSKEGIKSSAKTKPTGNPSAGSFEGPGKALPSALKPKGGKDLPAPSFDERKHFDTKGELPKGI